MSVVLYGIKNCDTVKKARRWLDDAGQTYHFHDFRVDGLEQSQIEDWLTSVDPDVLLNRRGTTWRKLSEAEKDAVTPATLPSLLAANPTLIKRPVLSSNTGIEIGFSADRYSELFNV